MSNVAGFEPALSRPKIWRNIHSATQYVLNLSNCYTDIQNIQQKYDVEFKMGYYKN